MDTSRLNQVLKESKITKRELASRAKISRMTLDALLGGADTKISTLEADVKQKLRKLGK